MSNTNNITFIKAVKYAYENIDKILTVENLAEKTHVSTSTLKRLFRSTTGTSIGAFIRKLRMEHAFKTLQSKESSILEIALQSGFDDHSAFARCFKNTFGYSPTSARTKTNIVNELEHIILDDPEIIEIQGFSLWAITKQGLYFEAAPQAWQELKTHLTATELSDDFMGSFIGIGHDNPHENHVSADKVRFSAGITHLDGSLHLKEITLTGATYAKFHYSGTLQNLGLAYHYIYGTWRNKSKFIIDKQKVAFILLNELPEKLKEYRLAIYVPLRPINVK